MTLKHSIAIALSATLSAVSLYGLVCLIFIYYPNKVLAAVSLFVHMRLIKLLAPYFHITTQSLIGGVIFIATWTFLYVFIAALIYTTMYKLLKR